MAGFPSDDVADAPRDAGSSPRWAWVAVLGLAAVIATVSTILVGRSGDPHRGSSANPEQGGILAPPRPEKDALLASDTAAGPSPLRFWAAIDCDDGRSEGLPRYSWIRHGGDTGRTATGAPQGNRSFRRLRVVDGDDLEGERCELGRNDRLTAPSARFFREGKTTLTFISLRLERSFPLDPRTWQVVLQFKQTQPADNGGGTPTLALAVEGRHWVLSRSSSAGYSRLGQDLWRTPARRGVWSRFVFVTRWSSDPEEGAIRVFADSDGDGAFTDPGERSPRITTFTLKREIAPLSGVDDDGIEPGSSIPAHLRVGVYHDPAVECPPPAGCAIDIDNVQIARG